MSAPYDAEMMTTPTGTVPTASLTPASIPTIWERCDSRFDQVAGDTKMEVLWTGGRWLEGPAYFPAGRYLVFSDIPNDRLLRWDETTGAVGVLRAPAGFTNGNIVDRQGRLVSCEHGGRRVVRTEHNGTTTVIAERYEGARFNSPNDLVESTDGSIWFTDPSYGIDTAYEGNPAPADIDGCHVYRVSPQGAVTRVIDDMVRPNGLAFDRGERSLYVVDTRRRHLRRFTVDGHHLTGGEEVARCDDGSFDGIRLDEKGRVWAATGEGVHCYHQDGTLLGKLLLPEEVSNLTFGGAAGNHLFICASTSVYAIRLNVRGLLRL